jgi:hypothetical protein
MRITFDLAKRDATLVDRGLDFADASIVFAGITLEVEDTRKDWRDTRHLLWPPGRPDGRGGLHTAWRGSSHLQYEESQ